MKKKNNSGPNRIELSISSFKWKNNGWRLNHRAIESITHCLIFVILCCLHGVFFSLYSQCIFPAQTNTKSKTFEMTFVIIQTLRTNKSSILRNTQHPIYFIQPMKFWSKETFIFVNVRVIQCGYWHLCDYETCFFIKFKPNENFQCVVNAVFNIH